MAILVLEVLEVHGWNSRKISSVSCSRDQVQCIVAAACPKNGENSQLFLGRDVGNT